MWKLKSILPRPPINFVLFLSNSRGRFNTSLSVNRFFSSLSIPKINHESALTVAKQKQAHLHSIMEAKNRGLQYQKYWNFMTWRSFPLVMIFYYFYYFLFILFYFIIIFFNALKIMIWSDAGACGEALDNVLKAFPNQLTKSEYLVKNLRSIVVQIRSAIARCLSFQYLENNA